LAVMVRAPFERDGAKGSSYGHLSSQGKEKIDFQG
jgi:hypothetical protein